MVWVGRDLSDNAIPAPCHGQGHLPLDQFHLCRGFPDPTPTHPGGTPILFPSHVSLLPLLPSLAFKTFLYGKLIMKETYVTG